MNRLFIVGAAKSGTTSLYKYLKQHPDLFFSPVKEPNYFSDVFPLTNSEKTKPIEGKEYHSKVINSKKDYDKLFSAADSGKYKYLCESSNSYFFDKNSASKIKHEYPDSKIIIMIRNPIHRAYSHYKMYYNSGIEKNHSFYEALKKDQQKKNKVWGKDFCYIDLGLYNIQFQRYAKLFDKSQIHILIFEDFIKNTQQNLIETSNFLGISPNKFESNIFNEKHNESLVPKNIIIKSLFRLKNDFYYVSENLPSGLKIFLKRKFFKKEIKKSIEDKAVSLVVKKTIKDFKQFEQNLPTDLVKNYTSRYFKNVL